MQEELESASSARPAENPNSFVDLISSLFFHRTDAVFPQAVRFAMAGAAATVVDWSTLHTLTKYAGLRYWASAIVAYILGMIVSYVLSVKWVFVYRTIDNRTLEFTVFVIIGVVGLGLTELIMVPCVEVLHLHYLVGKAIATVLVFFWNFGARRWLMFNRALARKD